MAEWIFNRAGRATMIFDTDCVRDRRGKVIGWVVGRSLYDLRGSHIGWYEGGVLFDSQNRVIGFTRSRTRSLPSTPGISGTPGMPGFYGRPGRPGLSGTPGRPGYSGWSTKDLATYFDRP